MADLSEQCDTVKHYLDSEKLEANIGTFHPNFLQISAFSQRKLIELVRFSLKKNPIQQNVKSPNIFNRNFYVNTMSFLDLLLR